VARIGLPLKPIRVVLGAGSVWVSAQRVLSARGTSIDATVFRIDPATNRIVARIPLRTHASTGSSSATAPSGPRSQHRSSRADVGALACERAGRRRPHSGFRADGRVPRVTGNPKARVSSGIRARWPRRASSLGELGLPCAYFGARSIRWSWTQRSTTKVRSHPWLRPNHACCG